jgi:hypothetical protein
VLIKKLGRESREPKYNKMREKKRGEERKKRKRVRRRTDQAVPNKVIQHDIVLFQRIFRSALKLDEELLFFELPFVFVRVTDRQIGIGFPGEKRKKSRKGRREAERRKENTIQMWKRNVGRRSRRFGPGETFGTLHPTLKKKKKRAKAGKKLSKGKKKDDNIEQTLHKHFSDDNQISFQNVATNQKQMKLRKKKKKKKDEMQSNNRTRK